MDRRFNERIRRHPLCPKCRYDLVATIDANKRICPECGYEFSLNELIRAPREGDWTPATGLRDAAMQVLVRMLMLLPIWAAAYGLISIGIATIPGPGWGMMTIVILVFFMFIPGMVIGKMIAKELTETAGMVSGALTALAALGAVGVAYGGPMLAHLVYPVSYWYASCCGFLASGVALIFVIKDTLVES